MPDLEQEIIIETRGRAGLITLDRPSALNALNIHMVSRLSQTLDGWRDDPDISCVILHAKGERAFCAGGDLRSVYEARQQANLEVLPVFFRQEYQLNNKIHQFPKPYISLLHGYTMGGGMGISILGSHRIVSEDVQLAMPEVTIGYFPDVGASYFLNQCSGFLGMYLALTGSSVSAADALYTGLATHFISRTDYADLLEALCRGQPSTGQEVEEILSLFQKPVPVSLLKEKRKDIDRLFGLEEFDDIVKALEQEHSEFSNECLKMMSKKSPSSLKVTFELLKRMRGQTLRETLQYDFLLFQKFIRHPDFFEGIRAVIIDKDHNPQWHPKSLDEVTQNIVEEYFTAQSAQKLFD